MHALHRWIARLRAWRAGHGAPDAAVLAFMIAMPAQLGREVRSDGVRFYGLCASCGGRLDVSATLCDACAQSRETRPGTVGDGY